MPDPLTPAAVAAEGRHEDLRLWAAMLLGPLAAACNTIVGFTVAHWTADTNRKVWSYAVSGIDFALCITGIAMGYSLVRVYRAADDHVPADGRRAFMAKLAILLSVFSALVAIAGTLAVIILHSSD